MVPFATPDRWPVDETPVQNALDDSPSMGSDKIIDEFIQQRAFMIFARYDPQTGVEEEFSGPVGVD